jgi:hypothetical protein
MYLHTPLALYLRRGSGDISDILKHAHFTNDLTMRHNAKPIGADRNPLFYDIHGRNGEILSRTPHETIIIT